MLVTVLVNLLREKRFMMCPRLGESGLFWDLWRSLNGRKPLTRTNHPQFQSPRLLPLESSLLSAHFCKCQSAQTVSQHIWKPSSFSNMMSKCLWSWTLVSATAAAQFNGGSLPLLWPTDTFKSSAYLCGSMFLTIESCLHSSLALLVLSA